MAVTKVPWKAIWPCATMVLLIYIYLAVGIFKLDSKGYELLQEQDEEEEEEEQEEEEEEDEEEERRDPALVLAAVLYWVLMPSLWSHWASEPPVRRVRLPWLISPTESSLLYISSA